MSPAAAAKSRQRKEMPPLVKRLERVARKLKCSRSRAVEQAVVELCDKWAV